MTFSIANLYRKKDYYDYAYYKTNIELIQKNEDYRYVINRLMEKVNGVTSEKQEQDTKIKEQEEEIVELKAQLLKSETKLNYLTETNSVIQLKLNTKNDCLETQHTTIQVLEKQIHAISEALNNTHTSLEKILSEKSRLVGAKFKDFIEDDIEFKEIQLPDYFSHSYNFNFNPFYNQVPQSQVLNPQYIEPNNNNNYNNTNNLVSLRNVTNSDEAANSESNLGKRLITDEDKPAVELASDAHLNLGNISRMDKSSNFFDERKQGTQKVSFMSHFDLQSIFGGSSEVSSRHISLLEYKLIESTFSARSALQSPLLDQRHTIPTRPGARREHE